MSRIRTIKPEFWQDEDVAALSFQARLLFIACWNLADDEGLLKWSPQFLKGQVFAYDDVSVDDVRGLMMEIERGSFVHPYKDGKAKSYGWIVNFRKHQKINKPQPPKHPVPSIQNREIRERYAERDGWCCHICGDPIEYPTDDNRTGLSLDHVNPQSRGGTDHPSNIRAAHKWCNSGKKDKAFTEHSMNGGGTFKVGKERKGTGNREQGIRTSHPREILGKEVVTGIHARRCE